MFHRMPLIFLLAILATAARAEGPPPAAPLTAVHAGRLIDVDAGQVVRDPWIVVRGERIVSVGSHADVPSEARVIELGDATVLPGLIDCHTHLVGDARDTDPVAELLKTSAQRAFESIPNARVTLLAGFTTVRDVGTYRALVDLALRDAINRGDVVGPRMYVAGGYITITGGGGTLNGIAPDVTLPWDLRFGVADGPEQVRQRVRAFEQYGVDLIKIIATGAFLSHGSNPLTEDFSYDEVRAAVEEAQRKGLPVAAHAHSTRGIRDAIRAGVTSIEHGTFLDDEGIRMMREHGTYLVADIYDDECIKSTDPAGPVAPADFSSKLPDAALTQRRNFEKAVRAGVRIAFGTDASVCPHGSNARQFAYQVLYGQTPMQAIQSATINAANLIGHADQFGSVRAGKRADLIAVRGDPLADVRQLEHVHFVMKDGVVYKNEPAEPRQ